jgi:uncharacterized protein YbjT (DUF2867 family)
LKPFETSNLNFGFNLPALGIERKYAMKFVVIGGTGLIGTKVVNNLRERGHEVVAASPSSGVNTITGEGLAAAVAGADVVVDVSNSPAWEDGPVMDFFTTSTTNLLAAEKAAGVRHHVALSVVGADRLPESGYMRAKVAQENLIKSGGIPYTVLRATQFFEFLGSIAAAGADGNTIHLPTALLQPVAAEDVAAAVTDVAVGKPQNGIVDLAGPEAVPFADIVRRYLKAKGDAREVVPDRQARYYGAALAERSLVPAGSSRTGSLDLEHWLAGS